VGERDGIAGVTGMEASEQSRAPEPREPNPPRYWFPAKRYGWGWGMPCAWQGWLVLVGYLGLMVGVARLCPPEKSVLGFVAAVLGTAFDQHSAKRPDSREGVALPANNRVPVARRGFCRGA
jgi:hypothetical protein